MARLLFVSHFSRLSGPAQSLLLLLKYLRREHEVTVVVPQAGQLSHRLQQEGIACYLFPFRRRRIPALAWLIWREGFDLVYGNSFSGSAYIALLATRLLRKPFVWHMREVFPQEPVRPALFRRPRHAQAIVAVSKASARSVQHHLPGREVSVVYNGVEVADFSISRGKARAHVCQALGLSDDGVLIINVGHICPRKNQQQAVKAAARVIKDHPSVTFCFLGMLDHSPQYTADLKELIARLGITGNIHLAGFCDDIATYLRGADVLLHASTRDPHPRAVIEGMAAELPVVAYDVDGVSETVVSGQTGILVPLGDVAAMAGAVAELVQNPAQRGQMGRHGCRRVEALFTAERTAQQVNTVIERVLQR